MEFPPELNKSEVIDEAPSPFDIRLNNTYIALYTTNEPIDIAVTTRFLDEIDDVILRSKSAQDQKRNKKNNKEEYSEEYDGISVLRYTPESHAYHKNQVDAYFRDLDQDETLNSVQKKLSLGYSIFKHRFSNYEYRTALWEKFSSLNPDKSDINFVEGAFDILDYRGSSLELRYNDHETEDRIQFTFFFAIRLGTELISNIDDFLNYHLSHNFGGDVKKFTRFLELTCTEYKEQLISEGRCKLTKEWKPKSNEPEIENSESQEGIISNQINQISTVVSLPKSKKVGRKVVEKLEISVTPSRTKGDKMTVFSVQETAVFVNYLQKINIILAEDYIAKDNLAKAMQILTGYSHHNISAEFDESTYNEQTLEDIRKKIKKVILLIDKDLSKRLGSKK